MTNTFSIIAAADSKMGIGKNGKLPWHLSSDLKYFNKITVGKGNNAVIMGRLTWESIPEKKRPLLKRKNIVITRNSTYSLPREVEKAESFEEGLKIAANYKTSLPAWPIGRQLGLFIIGGSQIFHDAINHPQCTDIYLTEIDGDFGCDTFFPKIDTAKFKKIFEDPQQKENNISFRFCRYKREIALD